MSNEQAPECCPFCGAGIHAQLNSCADFVNFACGSAWSRGDDIPRRLQDDECATAERERLTRERGEAFQKLTEMAFKAGELTARVKRLEDAGDAIVDHNIGCGCGQDGPCRACRMACEAWTKAKEAKP